MFRTYLFVVGVGAFAFLLFSSSIIPNSRVQAVTLPTSITISICGDGIINAGEVCDDGFGANFGGYGSSTAERKCNADCQTYGPYCGDGILQVRFSEECDDSNNVSGDLCAASCLAEVPAAPPFVPPRGSIPNQGGPTGSILSELATRVVLRGKAFPNTDVHVLLDGEEVDKVRTDTNAEFLYSATNISPGTATIGLWANDRNGAKSITATVVFEVVQSAVTTVAGILIPPSLSLNETQFTPGEPINVSGESVPNATIQADIAGGALNTFNAEVAEDGTWSIQIDSNSLANGFNAIKALFSTSAQEQSGYGRSVSFYIGTEPLSEVISPDVNGDGRVNLVDFSIFLISWDTDDIRYDFNQDGTVSLADFSILLFNWTG